MKKTGKLTAIRAQLFTIVLTALLCVNAGLLHAQTTLYVKPTATGTGDGSSWANASGDLQLMINNSAAGDSIFVAAGTYKPNRPANDLGTINVNNRDNAFVLKADVKIHGGFAGTEPSLAQRIVNPAAPSILSGDIGNAGPNFDNCLHVVISADNVGTAVLEGFTITDGNANTNGNLSVNTMPLSRSNGGGIYCYASSPSIKNCTFANNTVALYGGAIYNRNSSPAIDNCIFSGNSSHDGGGMYNEESAPQVISCTFSGNITQFLGGGMHNYISPAIVTDCIFSANLAGSGGGMYNEECSPVITGCSFSNNISHDGGGICNQKASPAIINSHFFTNNAKSGGGTSSGGGILNRGISTASISGCTFTGNNADGWGGGIENANQSNLTLNNCRFSLNTASSGGGIDIYNISTADILNCDFSGNAAINDGGAIFNEGYVFIDNSKLSGNTANYGGAIYMNFAISYSYIYNSIFSGNKALHSGGSMYNKNSGPTISNCTFAGNNATFGGGIYNYMGSAPVISNSIIWGHSETILNNNSTATISYSIVQGGYPGIGNQNIDPLFNLAPSYTTAPFTGGNYTLQPCSPGVNTGSDALVPVYITRDFAGNPRINSVSVDMGAYEYTIQPTNNNVLYVNSGLVSGTGDGSSWANALPGVADALLYAKANEASWTATSPLKIFVAKGVYKPLFRADNISCTAVNTNDRDNAFLMINNVEVYGGFDPVNGIDDLTDTRIFGANGSILSGDIGTVNNSSDNCYHVVIFSANHSTLDGFTITGGNANGSSTIIVNGNTIDRNNGGAIYGTASDFNTSNCIFTGNIAANGGGAVYNNGNITPVYTNCSFSQNSAQLGGAMANNLSRSIITNCNFSSNTASDRGGGIHNYAASYPAIANCTFLSNTAGLLGGGIFSESGSATTITACLFTGNNTQFGGALFINNGQPVIKDCIFSGNWAASYGGAVYNNGALIFPIYTNCIFSGNWTVNFGGGGGAMFNNNALPLIFNATFSGNIADFGAAIHNYNTAASSIENSVIWGNSSGIYNESAASALVEYTLIQGGYAGIGNLNTNPLFINSAVPAGADGIWGTADDGLRLQVCSPVINAGNNALLPPGTTTDLVGHSRVQLTTVDMGAYEANSFATGAAANIATSNTVTSAWQIRNAKTYYSTNCTTLVAAVTGDGTSTAVQGNTVVKTWIETTPPPQFVKRHYEITPQDVTPATATGTITLYFTQPEFDAFNALNAVKLPQGPADATGKANLLIEKRSGVSNNNTGLPPSYTGAITTINPNDADIVWNVTAFRWEISFAVTGFSGFFVKTISIPLPLKLISFTANENNCIATIEWVTADEINVSHFEVEQSINGSLFSTIKNIPARNTGNETTYTITAPVANAKIFYRLKMVDIDGRTTYSPVRLITAACDNRIVVYPNPAKDKLYIRNANPGNNYAIYDNTGRRIIVGRITNTLQEIYIAGIASGIYHISIETENESGKQIRFVKE